jgi:hypothetical protein
MAADQGLLRTHTPAGADGDRGQDEAAAELGGADPADLLLGLPDLDGDDVLALTADLANATRRARGRPAGSGNRKNADMIAYLAARGHRDPWVTLSMIQSADTKALAIMLRRPLSKNGKPLVNKDGQQLYSQPDMQEALAMQMRAADAIMPYHHGKKPQQLELLDPGARRPLMVIGEVNVTNISHEGFATAGELPAQQDQGLIEGEAVREQAAPVEGGPSP